MDHQWLRLPTFRWFGSRDEDGIVRGFLLEKGMEGFTSSDIHGKLSLRASVTSELSMTNVRVPDSARLPNIEGLKGPLSCLTQARFGDRLGVWWAQPWIVTTRPWTIQKSENNFPNLCWFPVNPGKVSGNGDLSHGSTTFGVSTWPIKG